MPELSMARGQGCVSARATGGSEAMTSTRWRATGIALLACATCMATAGSVDARPGRATSALTCALQIPNRLVNRNPRASTRLVPAGADSLLLCRYGGLNAGPNAVRALRAVSCS